MSAPRSWQAGVGWIYEDESVQRSQFVGESGPELFAPIQRNGVTVPLWFARCWKYGHRIPPLRSLLMRWFRGYIVR